MPALADEGDGEAEDQARHARMYACGALRSLLRTAIDISEALPIRLRATPVAQGEIATCDGYQGVAASLRKRAPRDVESGTIDGHRAAVRSDGPHGSGRFWDVLVAVDLDGKTVGACLNTSTSGWRNIGAHGGSEFGRWRPLSGDRFVLWSTLVVGAAEYDSLLVPLLYRLSGSELVLDRAATLVEIGRFGAHYADLARRRRNDDRLMHGGAAAAYTALSMGGVCPKK